VRRGRAVRLGRQRFDHTTSGRFAAAESLLAGYIRADGVFPFVSGSSQHVNFIDNSGHVHELYLANGASNCVDDDSPFAIGVRWEGQSAKSGRLLRLWHRPNGCKTF